MPRTIASGLALAVLLAACTTGPGATGTPQTGTPTPGTQPTVGTQPTPVTQPPPAVTEPPPPVGTEPTPGTQLTPGFSIPSFAPDTTLEAAFPDTIDGQPVTDVQTLSFLALLQAFETDQAVIDAFVAAMQGIGVDPASVAFGTATATVGGEEVSIQALRAPGGSAAAAIDALIRLDPPEVPPTITTETIGGKTVTVSTLSDGEEEFYFSSGEIGWFLPDATREQAEIIFQALP